MQIMISRMVQPVRHESGDGGSLLWSASLPLGWWGGAGPGAGARVERGGGGGRGVGWIHKVIVLFTRLLQSCDHELDVISFSREMDGSTVIVLVVLLCV